MVYLEGYVNSMSCYNENPIFAKKNKCPIDQQHWYITCVNEHLWETVTHVFGPHFALKPIELHSYLPQLAIYVVYLAVVILWHYMKVTWGQDLHLDKENSDIVTIINNLVVPERFERTGVGCHIGHEYSADHLALLAPSLFSPRLMLKICEELSVEYDVISNAKKTV